MSEPFRLAALFAVLAFPATASAWDLPEQAPAPKSVPDRADALAAVIDEQLTQAWKARGVVPAQPADDAEFVRRVYLDVIGRAPRAAEARDFIDDRTPGKREALVEKLLTTPAHANYFASVTRGQWLPAAGNNPLLAQFSSTFEQWLATQYRKNTTADQVVRQILSVKVTVAENPNLRIVQGDPTNPDAQFLAAFYSANEGKAENSGAAVSRLFLGVRLECAQCHDHPFATYSRDQFWQFAAFFADLNITSFPEREPGGINVRPDLKTLQIVGTDRKVTAVFPDGTDPVWTAGRLPREVLADWLVSRTNPYFAPNMANRVWTHFFGVGIQDPVDEPGEANPPSHPRLLAELGRSFADAGFDNRMLIKAITRSRAYQLTSKISHPSQADRRSFARMNLKGLTPPQLFDSLVAATGFREGARFRNQANFGAAFAGQGNQRAQFLTRFATTDRPTEANTTILQALMLMNGEFIGNQTDLAKSEILAAVVDMPGWDTKQRLSALFMTAFARQPTPDELDKFGSYVDRRETVTAKHQALADVFWVLLNSPEFLFNH